MYFDIHSHILPGVDDGAADINESLELLKLLRKNAVSKVIATPHFYPDEVVWEDFFDSVNEAYSELNEMTHNGNYPEIFLGCEVLYYNGMSRWDSLDKLCLNNSGYLLLELTDGDIGDSLFEDITDIGQNFGITPIIAHIERYNGAKKFKKLLEFVKKNNLPVQINASSVMASYYKKSLKLIFENCPQIVMGSDTHSVKSRPPMIREAYNKLRDEFGKDIRSRVLNTTSEFESLITGDNR